MPRKVVTRAPTGDRGPPGSKAVDVFVEAEQLSENRQRMPNGNLLCRNVPLARVGWMMYGPGEVPLEPDPSSGLTYVNRTAEELFTPVFMGSLLGSAVVDDHPDLEEYPEGVTRDNWPKLSRGFVLDVWRGEGEDSDLLLGDLVITDAPMIESIEAGKREISAGYDADYEQISPGVGEQHNLLGNHIALVEKGRCGPRCAIGDQAHQLKGNEMPMPKTKRVTLDSRSAKRRTVLDAARRKVQDAQAELEEIENGEDGMSADDEMPGGNGGTHIHIHAGGVSGAPQVNSTDSDEDKDADKNKDGKKTDDNEDRLAALEAGHAAILDQLKGMGDVLRKLAGAESAETKTGDEDPDDKDKDKKTEDAEDPDEKKESDKSKTQDSAALASSFAQVQSQAEILVPGFRMPTFDAAAKRTTTMDAMCSARRKALGLFGATADGAKMIKSLTGDDATDLDKMDCKDTAILFKAAAGAKALLNNSASTHDSSRLPQNRDVVGNVQTLDDINAANAKFWAQRNAESLPK